MSAPTDKSKETVLINENNVQTSIVHSEYRSIYDGTYWHKIYVQNALNCKRNFVLKTLMKTVHPLDFIPVHYTIEDENVCFLLKNCGAAIMELCKLNLIVPNPNPKEIKPFKISILLKFAHAGDLKIDIQATITKILNKRTHLPSKTLNLDSFSQDPHLIEFCTLSQPKLMYFVLHLSKGLPFENLRLSKNEIELLKPLEALATTVPKKIVSLDLRRNNIKSFHELMILRKFSIQELWLDENPICENISEYDYIASVREHCPKLLKLDGFKFPPQGMPSLRRTFLCNRKGQALVDQFLEHYITLYDSEHRNVLESVYHNSALFSMTAIHLLGHSTSSNLNVFDYKKVSRNIQSISDYSRSGECMFSGPLNIVNVLKRLPRSKHDQFSFTVDMTFYSLSSVVFTVTGMFRESSEHLLEEEKLYGFTRTFVLIKVGTNEYSIVNEMLHISNATSSQHQRAFKFCKVPKPFYVKLPLPQTDKEKDEMVDGVSQITNLRVEWARKLLQDCKFDFKESLNLFIYLFKGDKLPSRAFMPFESYEEDEVQFNQVNELKMLTNIVIPQKKIFKKTVPPPPPNISSEKAQEPNKRIDSNVIIDGENRPIAFVDTGKIKQIAETAGVSSKKMDQMAKEETLEQSSSSTNTSSNSDTVSSVNAKIGTPIYMSVSNILAALHNLPDSGSAVSLRDHLNNAAASLLALKSPNPPIGITRDLIHAFYKNNLHTEAREYMKHQMSMICNDKKSVQLYKVFLESELKFGDVQHAESVFNELIKVNLNKACRCVPDLINKLNVPTFTRRMINKLLTMKLNKLQKNILYSLKLPTVEQMPQQTKYTDDYLIFRKKLLVKVGLFPESSHPSIPNLDLKKLSSMPIDDLNKQLFAENLSNYAVLKVVLFSFSLRLNLEEVNKFLDAHVNVDQNLREDLKILYRLRLLERRLSFDECVKVLQETVMSGRNCLNIFEELNDYQTTLRYYKAIMAVPQPNERLFIISLLSMTFAKRFGMIKPFTYASEVAHKCGTIENFFHPDDVIMCPKTKEFRDWYTSQTVGELTEQDVMNFLKTDPMIESNSEAVRACLYHKLPNLAKKIKNSIKLKRDPEKFLNYKICLAIANGKFGSVSSSAIDILNGLQPRNVSIALAEIDVYINMPTINRKIVNSKIHELITTFPLNITPAFLETLYKYHNSWKDHINLLD
ncbi:PREDICTED: uncharacterized protein LOC108559648 isoform X1 [Nicrophorus vespilloides]|uniref:Uncharacterized protein LOC108559648 isoform X1 n=1 Tax=Nicrophorus vespilloides TaxID=110193 RepID=A0ABM1MD35_NICVS|nr:PREDICTED: uncharacterized protein LOC108559648 isoform X1 [Nicrophorus vespilloides]